MKHIMTGISFVIPIIVAGGTLGALAKASGGWDIGSAAAAGATPFSDLNSFIWVEFRWGVNRLSLYAMDFTVVVMTAGAAYSTTGQPGTVPGLITDYCSVQLKAGFSGDPLMTFIIGNFVNWMKTWKLPKWCERLMPVMFIPAISTLVYDMTFLCVLSILPAWIMDMFQQWIIFLNGDAKPAIGAVIGARMGLDMGEPANKTASIATNALGVDGINGPVCAKIIGGMTPPIGLFIAIMIKKNKFTRAEPETAKTALPTELCFITEGVLPLMAADPARFILSSTVGSAVAGAIAVDMGCESMAGYGGIFAVLPPALVVVLQSLMAIRRRSMNPGSWLQFWTGPLAGMAAWWKWCLYWLRE